MSDQRTVGLILAGSHSRRLGPDKCWLAVGGVPMIVRVCQAVARVVDDILVVGGDRGPSGIDLVADERAMAGPLAAIATGMHKVPADAYLVVSCDVPFVSSELLACLVDALVGADAVVPVVSGRDQPLCAAYSSACLAAIEQALARGQRRVDSFFEQVGLRRIPEKELRQFGSPDRLLLNVNTPEDLARARQLAETVETEIQ